MRSRTVFLVSSVALAGAALWFAFNQRTVRAEAERALADRRQQQARSDAAVRDAEQHLATLVAEQQRVNESLEAARKKSAASSAAAAQKRPAVLPSTLVREALLHDPQLQNLQLAVAQSRLIGTYRPLVEQLKLSEAQTTQFLALLHQRTEQQVDLAATAEIQRLASTDPVLVKMKREMADEFRTAQTALLGEAGFRQFETYERSVPARDFVNEFAGTSAIAGCGLAPQQGDALVQILAQASPPYQNGGMVSLQNVEWDRSLAGARPVLSEQQFALLKAIVTQSRNMDKMRELARRK